MARNKKIKTMETTAISRRKSISFETAILGLPGDLAQIGEMQLPLLGRKTKIICTIGPATQATEILCKMIVAGMNIARLNFSHGSHEYHLETIRNVRQASALTHLPCAILLDTKGRAIRTGLLQNGQPVELVRGSAIRIHCAPPASFRGTASDISVDYAALGDVVAPGRVVKIADGLILIRVIAVAPRMVHGELLNSQVLGEKKGVNIPGVETGLPAMSAKDEADIRFGLQHGVDFLAPSFINSADDVAKIRALLGAEGAQIRILAKIESEKGMHNFGDILQAADGIMVARGDLGVEIPVQKVCMTQKTMISKCNAVGKPIVTATQMMESMIKNPSPTRAEVADVANAVFDGSDCVMLSGESANGAYPVEAVSIMARICRRSEASINYEMVFRHINSISLKAIKDYDIRTESVTAAAVKICNELKAKLIFALTDSGRTAGYVSKYMPPVPIVCVTPKELTARQAMVRKGLWPFKVAEGMDDEQRYDAAREAALAAGWCQLGDTVVVVCGKSGVTGSSYQLRVVNV